MKRNTQWRCKKGDYDDHQKRVRYIGSNVDTRITEKGIDFKDIPDVYVIYLTKFDVFGKKKDGISHRPDHTGDGRCGREWFS